MRLSERDTKQMQAGMWIMSRRKSCGHGVKVSGDQAFAGWRVMEGPSIARAMSDRLVLSLIALAALALIGLSLVWPQGLGRPSPPPFGHPLAPLAQPPHLASPTPQPTLR